LRTLVAEAVEQLQSHIRERALRVDIASEPANELAEVSGDRQKLGSLVGNLLDNAVRNAPERSTIEVALRRTGDEVSLSVADEGRGIPPELRERVFESYYRMPGSAGSGSGLGLAIVKETAQTHGASVEISDARAGRGTRVVVRFRSELAPRTLY
jgi:signal transduction histidine kinase